MAATAGVLVAVGLGATSGPPPATQTVTVNVATGPKGDTGPPGPPGPPGPAGALVCPDGFEVGDVVINHPGGQVTIYGCIKT